MTRTRLWPTALAGVLCVVTAAESARAADDQPAPPIEQLPPSEPPDGARDRAPTLVAQATTPVSESATRSAGAATTMEQVAEAGMQEIRLGGGKLRYSLNYFGDTSFSVAHPATVDGGFPSFSIGVQDFLVRGELGKHIVATTEFAFEVGDDGVTVDIERMHVRWQKDDFFVEAGRMHTVLGYWNNAYHHGRWLQPMIERPRWVAFEDDDGILPVHWVGVDAGVRLRAGTGSVNITASVGNGRGKIVDDIRNAHDYQAGKAVHLAIEYLGVMLPDLRLGAAGIYSRIPGQPDTVRPALPDASIDEWIGSLYAAYPSVPLLVIAEGYLVNHRHGDQEWSTYGGFGLLGYTFGPLTPYLQFERIIFKGGTADPFFVPNPATSTATWNSAGFIAGLRLDLSDWTALKAEYRNTTAFDHDSQVTQEGVLNWSWGF